MDILWMIEEEEKGRRMCVGRVIVEDEGDRNANGSWGNVEVLKVRTFLGERERMVVVSPNENTADRLQRLPGIISLNIYLCQRRK